MLLWFASVRKRAVRAVRNTFCFKAAEHQLEKLNNNKTWEENNAKLKEARPLLLSLNEITEKLSALGMNVECSVSEGALIS